MRLNCSLPHWERVSVSRCRCMPQGNSGPFTQCVLRCRTRKLSRTAIVTAKLGLRWWIEFRWGSLTAETYPKDQLARLGQIAERCPIGADRREMSDSPHAGSAVQIQTTRDDTAAHRP